MVLVKGWDDERIGDNMEVHIRLTDAEWKFVEAYAIKHSISMEVVFKQALFERIEDECDLQVAVEALYEFNKTGRKSRNISKLWEEIDK